jgi:hypothetical protein
VVRHHSPSAVTEGDRPVGVLVHQCLVQRTSDGEPTFGNGDWCLGHVAFGVLGTELLALETHGAEFKFHSL